MRKNIEGSGNNSEEKAGDKALLLLKGSGRSLNRTIGESVYYTAVLQ